MFKVKNIKGYALILKLLVIPGVSLLLSSCENDIEKIHSITSQIEHPELSAENAIILYSDSGKVEMKLTANRIAQFSKAERPYIEFPDGIYVEFYDDSLNIESQMRSNYAIYYMDDKRWEARGDVEAINKIKGEKLNTEELFWDENKRTIYSNSFSRIETADGTFYGENGFESNQRFSKWRLKGSRGTVNLKENPNDTITN